MGVKKQVAVERRETLKTRGGPKPVNSETDDVSITLLEVPLRDFEWKSCEENLLSNSQRRKRTENCFLEATRDQKSV